MGIQFDLEHKGKPAPASLADPKVSRPAVLFLMVAAFVMGLLLFLGGFLSGKFIEGRQKRMAEADIDSVTLAMEPVFDQPMAPAQYSEPSISRQETVPDAVNATEPEAGPETVAEPQQPFLPFTVQVGAYSVKKNADKLLGTLKNKGYDPYMYKGSNSQGQAFYYVRLADFASRDEAVMAAVAFRKQEGQNAIVTKKAEEEQARMETGMVYSVQVGSFMTLESAREHAAGYVKKGLSPCIIRNPEGAAQPYDVQLAEFSSRREAESFSKEFRMREGIPSQVQDHDPETLKGLKQCLDNAAMAGGQ